jgi:hypothetical protein
MMYGTVSGSGSTTLHATVCGTLSHRGFGIYVAPGVIIIAQAPRSPR